jgi:hypothetical protein
MGKPIKVKLLDANKPHRVTWTKREIARAATAKKRGEPLQTSCVMWQGAMREEGIIQAVFARNTARLWWWYPRINTIKVRRYLYSNGKTSEARDVARGWDEFSGAMPGGATLYPPRGVRTLDHLRSDEMKAKREQSKAKRDKAIAQGKYKPRVYRAPSNQRYGLGKHDNIA